MADERLNKKTARERVKKLVEQGKILSEAVAIVAGQGLKTTAREPVTVEWLSKIMEAEPAKKRTKKSLPEQGGKAQGITAKDSKAIAHHSKPVDSNDIAASSIPEDSNPVATASSGEGSKTIATDNNQPGTSIPIAEDSNQPGVDQMKLAEMIESYSDGDLAKMIQQWKDKGTEPLPEHRPVFRSGFGFQITGIRVRSFIWNAAREKMKKEKVQTGGSMSALIELLLWEYAGRPQEALEGADAELDPKWFTQGKGAQETAPETTKE